MPNSIALISKYGAEQLDEIFVSEAVTGILENRAGLQLKPAEHDASIVYIPDMVLSGLGDYNKSTGFPSGDVTLAWTPYQCQKDRARGFQVDAVENNETAGIVAANIMKEFMRTKVIPEVDAYRLSKLYANAESANEVIDFIQPNEIISKFNNLIQHYMDKEIPLQSVVVFIGSTIDKLIRSTTELTRQIPQADFKVGEITFKVRKYDEMILIPVPATRFKSAYTFGSDGFTPAGGSRAINFLATHLHAALPYKKHEKIRVFDPDTNQDADAWKFQYRLYHDIITPKNKVDGIYVSLDTVAPVLTVTEAQEFASTLSVTFSAVAEDATVKIYYTTNGTTPTAASTEYSTAITVSATTTYKVIAIDSNGKASAVTSVTYTKES